MEILHYIGIMENEMETKGLYRLSVEGDSEKKMEARPNTLSCCRDLSKQGTLRNPGIHYLKIALAKPHVGMEALNCRGHRHYFR